MSSYAAGYESYWCDVAYDYYACRGWQDGWLDAEYDEYSDYYDWW